MEERTENIPGTGDSICRDPRVGKSSDRGRNSRVETAVTQGQGDRLHQSLEHSAGPIVRALF